MAARVLIVGEAADGLAAIERQLGDAGYETLIALADEALALARTDAPDVLILDGDTPDGEALCAAAKADGETAHIPVMMSVSAADSAARVRGFAAGADDFFVRPATRAELVARTSALVRLKSLTDEVRVREATGGVLGPRAVADVDPAEDRSTIAVIDDGSGLTAGLLTALGGFGAVATLPVERAVDRLRSTPCDMVVVALAEGRLDGLRLVSRLRSYRETRRLPILGCVDAENRGPLAKGFELGIDDAVTLPADMLVASVQIRTLLRRHRATARLQQDVRLSLPASAIDAATGLCNRNYMVRHLANLVARGRTNGGSLSVVLIEIDGFRQINERLGHAGGDAVLRDVAARVSNEMRSIDLAARFGGNRFAVVMPDAGHAGVKVAAERLRAAIAAAPITLGKLDRMLTISIGIATLRDGDEDATALLQRAREQLDRGKGGKSAEAAA